MLGYEPGHTGCELPTDRSQRFLRGLVFKAHRLVYHSTLGLRVTKKKKKTAPEMAKVPLRGVWGLDYRGTSLIRNRPTLAPYSRFMSRALWWS